MNTMWIKITGVLTNSEYFKRLFLLNSLFFSFFFFDSNPWISTITSTVFAVWAAVILLVKLTTRQIDLRRKHLWVLGLFVAVYIVSMLLNFRTELFGNVKTLINTGIVFLLVYYFDAPDQRQNERNLRILFGIISAYSFVMSLITMVFYFCNITLTVYAQRYCGIYSSPIMSGLVACVSIMVSVCCLLRWKTLRTRRRIFHIVQLLLQNAVLLIAGSRSPEICLLVFLCMLAALLLLNVHRLHLLVRLGLVLVSICVIVAGGILDARVTRTSLYELNVWMFSLREHPTHHTPTGVPDGSDAEDLPGQTDGPLLSIEPYPLDRTNEGASDNVRWNLITTGFEAFLRRPLFGVSPRNTHNVVAEIAEAENRNVVGIHTGGLHNSYLEILAGLGIAGMAVTLLFAVLFLRKILKILPRIWKDRPAYTQWAGLVSLIIACMASFLFESTMVFTISLMAVFFWSLMGYLSAFAGHIAEHDLP